MTTRSLKKILVQAAKNQTYISSDACFMFSKTQGNKTLKIDFSF